MGRSIAVAAALGLFITLFGSSAAAATPDARCANAKLQAAGHAVKAKLRCHGAAVQNGTPIESRCLERALQGLEVSFARAERRGGCATTGDAALVDAELDGAVATLLGLLQPAAPTPSPPGPTPTPAPDCADPAQWACCVTDHPQLGQCFDGFTGPVDSPIGQNFQLGCATFGGTWSAGRCPAATCGAAALCCDVGSCEVGTAGYFGTPDPEAIAELCSISGSGGTVLSGACPFP